MSKRREFLQTLLAALPAVMISCKGESKQPDAKLGDLLPQRKLGRTGEAVTMLGVGGYHIGWTTEKDAQATIEAALEGGVRFFDTAESYGKGQSEVRYGKYLTPGYREDVFLMTKTTGKDAATVQKHLDESLKRLNTDYLDLWQVHSIKDPVDVDSRIGNGVLDVFVDAKQSGKVRYIGFTGHSNPLAHKRMLERTADSDIFDTCQMPVNVLDPSYFSFITGVVPTLRERNIALLAMKTLADGRFFAVKQRLDEVQWETDTPVVPARLSIADALNFVWSLPVSVLITGAENAALLREKIEMAHSFTELDSKMREGLIEKVADLASDGKIEYFKKIQS
jgi:aryl-alcohol dehydrogenase-like predicted oxidoreductase